MNEYYSKMEPYPFAVIDNVLPNFEQVKNYAENIFSNMSIGIHQHMFTSEIDYKLYKKLEEVALEMNIEYYKKWDISSYNLEFLFQFSCYNTIHTLYPEYNVHSDDPSKVTSCIVALSDIGNLTEIHSQKENGFVYQPEWKQNRGVMFKRTSNSFHKVGEPLGNPRMTINIITINN